MKLQLLDKLGAVGSFLSALSCPACFPLLAIIGSAVGLGALHPYEGVIFYIFQGFVILALIGNILAYFNHRKFFPLFLGIFSPGLIFFVLYVRFIPLLLYIGLFGLLLTSIANYIESRRCKSCSAKGKEECL